MLSCVHRAKCTSTTLASTEQNVEVLPLCPQSKVYKYYPDEDQLQEPCSCGMVTVTLKAVHRHEHYLVRTFRLSVVSFCHTIRYVHSLSYGGNNTESFSQAQTLPRPHLRAPLIRSFYHALWYTRSYLWRCRDNTTESFSEASASSWPSDHMVTMTLWFCQKILHGVHSTWYGDTKTRQTRTMWLLESLLPMPVPNACLLFSAAYEGFRCATKTVRVWRAISSSLRN